MMRNFSGWKSSLVMLGLVAATGVAAAQTFTVPTTVTSYQTKPYVGLTQTQAVAVDAAGNIFYSQPASGALLEQPASGAAAITLYTSAAGSGGYPKGVAANNSYAYMTDYSGHLWQVPIGGGTATDIVSACGPIDGYYLGTQDVTTDGLGNVYVAGNNEAPLFKITASGACSVVAGVTLDANSHVAADAAGDLAYSTGGVLYSLPAGATTAVAANATLSAINGLRADAAGNVFVTTGSSIVEVPFINGALSGANQFTVLNQSSANDVAVGTDGTIYITDGSNLYINTMGNVRFAAATVGTPSATQTVNVLFNAATTLTGFRYAAGVGTSSEVANAGSGNCAAGVYAAGNVCTLGLTFTPFAPGSRRSSVVLLSATGSVGEVVATGQGTGAGLTVDPATQVALGTGWSAPAGVAVDASGAVFATDSTAGTLSYIAAKSTTATVIASGLSQPGAVAVGPDGNVFVACLGTNTLVEVPFNGTTFGTATTVLTGLNHPTSLQFGAGGSLFITNTGAGAVLRVPNQSGTPNFASKIIVASLTAPAGLAVDASGILYVSDTSAGTISKVSAGVTTTVVSGLSAPGPIAVDAAGSLYVLQGSTATAVTRIAYVSGSYSTNSTTSLGSGFAKLVSLAADSAGNLYVADATGPSVTMLQRTAGLLNLGKSNVGTPTSAQSLTFSNSGSAALTFGTPLYTTSGNTGDFTISTTAANTCAAGTPVATGSGCGIAASFDPTTQGTRTETLTISSNATNASPITGSFTGTGINLPKTTTTLTTTPSGTVTYGTTVTATAVVTPQAAGSTTTPTSTVTFLVNGVTYSTVTLVNGQASANITGLPAGTDTIDASYSGDTNYAASTGQTATIVVTLAPTMTTFSSSISSASSVAPGTSVTLTAKVSSNVTTSKPTGTVSFVTGTTTLATAPLDNTGTATVTTTTLPTGTYTIMAVYSGDAGFASSTSNGIQVAILAPAYVVSNTPTALTVTAPGSTNATFQITPISGYIGGVDFACSGLPANTQCAFAPATVQFNGTITTPQSVTLTITTDTPPPSSVAWLLPLSGVLLAGAWRKRRVFRARLTAATLSLIALFCLATFALGGCGSSSAANATPTGTSTVTVTMTGAPNGTTTVPATGTGNITKTFTFTLTVR